MTTNESGTEWPLVHEARVLCEQGDLEGAFSVVANALERRPEQPSLEGLASALNPRVIALLRLEQLKPQIVAWARFALSVPVAASASDPRLANIHWAAELIGRTRRAFPKEPQLYVAEALVRRRDPDHEAALAVAREGAALFPDVWPCRTALMHALADAGKLDQALVEAREALALEPNDGSPLHDVAWAFFSAGRKVEASALFDQLRERFPSYPLSKP